MSRDNQYFSKEYQQTQHTTGFPEVKETVYSGSENENATLYKSGKPKRITIRASIIHDKH